MVFEDESFARLGNKEYPGRLNKIMEDEVKTD